MEISLKLANEVGKNELRIAKAGNGADTDGTRRQRVSLSSPEENRACGQ